MSHVPCSGCGLAIILLLSKVPIMRACMLNQCMSIHVIDEKLAQAFQMLFLACLTYKLYPLKLWRVFAQIIKHEEVFMIWL